MQPARYPMLFQLLTPLLAHFDPLAGGISYQLNPSLATPGTSLSFRSAFSTSSAVCSLPCHRDPAMQPLHCALSPKRNIAHHTEILHNVFKSIKFSLLLTPLHNLMPITTWKRKFYLQCNYAILWPPFHQTHPSVWYFHSLISVPQGMICSIWKQGSWGTGTLTDLRDDKKRSATLPVLLCQMYNAVPLPHMCVLWKSNCNKK